jgi:transcriptional regulator with XRE-family HTH domain
MKTKLAFGKSLKNFRQAKGLTQEDFSVVSSRTYASQLERGQQSPTLDKIDALAKVLKIHPLSLLYLTYMRAGGHRDIDVLARRIRADLEEIV